MAPRNLLTLAGALAALALLISVPFATMTAEAASPAGVRGGRGRAPSGRSAAFKDETETGDRITRTRARARAFYLLEKLYIFGLHRPPGLET